MHNFTAKNGTEELKVFTPKSTEETEEIILYLKSNSAMVRLDKLRGGLKQRVVDVLSGASFVLDMALCLIDKNVLLIVKK